MSMFFVHLWLPRGHGEAPLSDSMIMAGNLFKSDGYGSLRVLFFHFSQFFSFLSGPGLT
jgi:NADH:ubiquinone oxidoreductase subunit 4 (subunit M)